jgi:hypothetical protein
MEVRGQLHAMANLPYGKLPLLNNEQNYGQAWDLCGKRNISFFLPRIETPFLRCPAIM